MSCCKSCEQGDDCECAAEWGRIEPIGDSISGGEAPVESDLSPSGAARFGVEFFLEPGSPADVAWKLSLGTAEGTVSQVYEMGECNTARVEVVTYNLEAGSIAGTKFASVELESSIDRENWRTESSTSIDSAGYATWAVRGVSGRFVRIRYLGGSDVSFKSIHAVTLTATRGPRRAGRRLGAA